MEIELNARMIQVEKDNLVKDLKLKLKQYIERKISLGNAVLGEESIVETGGRGYDPTSSKVPMTSI